MMAYTVLEKIKIKLAPLWHKKRSYIAVYKGMVVYKGPGDHCSYSGNAVRTSGRNLSRLSCLLRAMLAPKVSQTVSLTAWFA